MSEAGETEFVTVGVAAKRLGVADRTAQRYAAKLSDNDRQMFDTGAPQLVRLSAMQAKAKEAAARTVAAGGASGVRQADGQVSDNGAIGDGRVSDTIQAAFLAQLQGEVQFLRDALKAEQENTRAALAELHDARRESQIMLGAVAAGRAQIGPQTGEGEPQEPSDGVGTAPASSTSTAGGMTGAGGVTGMQTSAPWWAFWKAKSG